MKKQISAFALSSLLLFTGIAIAFSGQTPHTVPSLSLDDVLRAHNVPQRPNALAAFSAEARKLVYYPVAHGSEEIGHFERKVTVSTDGSSYKRHNVDPLGLREQTDIVGEQVAYRSEIKDGRQVGQVFQLLDSQSRAVKSAINMFGIIPILKQLQESSDEAVYLGRAEENQEKFLIKISSVTCTLYVDSRHLIRRIQMVRNHHSLTIVYDDYQAVHDVQIPFLQKLIVDGVFLYELFFTRIDLNPTFPEGYFSRDSLARESVR